jgi:hypothetical protein
MTTNTGTSTLFALIPIHPGQEIPADNIAWGSAPGEVLQDVFHPNARAEATRIITAANAALDQLNECYDQLELDREQYRADRQKLRDGAARLALSCDALEQRYIARDRARADAEAQQIQEDRIRQALDTLDQREAEIHHGELTTHPATEPHHEEQLEAMEHPADDEEQLHTGPSVLDQDGEGDLPNELLEEVPPDPGTDPDLPGTRPPTVRQPVAISLNAADTRRKANGHDRH